MSVLLLDNFDSFTYNLYDYLSALGYSVEVIRNDALAVDSVKNCSHIVLSPGPGLPQDAGCMMSVIETYSGKIPILGVCLGMQGIAVYFGSQLYNLPQVRHGQAVTCSRLGESILLNGIDDEFQVGLYHSWAVAETPNHFNATSRSEEGVLMSIEHKNLGVFGVQFHPESIMTPDGKKMLKNFLEFGQSMHSSQSKF